MSYRGSLRVQLSLIFEDETLYDELITPSKDDKTLCPLIIKLLSAYYYKPDFRALVDEASEKDVEEESENNTDMQEQFNNARNTIAMLDSFASMAGDECTNGLDRAIKAMSSMAEATGGTDAVKTDLYTSTPVINPLKSIEDKKSEEPVETINEDQFSRLEDLIVGIKNSLDSRLDKLEGAVYNGKVATTTPDVITKDAVKTVSTTASVEVSQTSNDLKQNFSSSAMTSSVPNLEEASVNSDETNKSEPKSDNPKPIDGSNLLNEIIGSNSDFF